MKVYSVKISRKAWGDVEMLSDFLLTVMSVAGARKYLDTMIFEVQSLAVFADLYRPSTMADIRRCHPQARRMVSHNRRWTYVFHIEGDTVIVDRLLKSKMIIR
ncbi:MAG: type II toxin-antitoxin system RelE/ParE family toxin [Bacteroidales bacterium]|nr:type II toxin-antitoxin system RelE/ParE family toxin [Bacteroidales bacterium]